MALTAKQKKALKDARSDGKISGKEATSLEGLGIPRNEITKTRGGKITVGRNVFASGAGTSNPYGATNKQQNKAIQSARKDGYVTNTEKRNLTSLGISKDKINDTRNGKVERVKTVPNIYKDASAVANNYLNPPAPGGSNSGASRQPASPSEMISNFSRDGEISKQEATKLAQRGVTVQDLKFNSSARLGQGAQNVLRKPVLTSQATTREENNAERTAQYKDPTGLGISRKDLFAMQAQALGGPQKWNGGEDDPDQGRYPGQGGINYAMYGGKEYIGQGKEASGNWKKVANALGIRTIDNQKDLARMFNFVNGASTGMTRRSSGSGNNGGSGSDGGFDRDSGEFDDIVGALGEDIDTNNNLADQFNNMGVNTNNPNQGLIDDLEASITDNTGGGNNGRNNGRNNGGNNGGVVDPSVGVVAPNPYQDLIDQLTLSNSELYATTQGIIDDNAVLRSSFDDALEAQALESTNALTGLNDLFLQSFNGIQDQMAQQQDDFNTAQAFTQQRLADANNMFLLEQQRTANLGNAYVPGANPNALSIAYGDNRNKNRQGQDNLLSDLTLMSGLGTQSNPLAGLQLA